MRNFLAKLLTPPNFEDDEHKTRVALYVHWIALVFIAAILLVTLFGKISAGSFTLNVFDAALLGVLVLLGLIWLLSRKGRVRAASLLLVAILWVAVNGVAFLGAGVRDTSFIANFVVLIAAGLLLGWKAAIALSALTIVAGFLLANAELAGITLGVYTPKSPIIFISETAYIFVIFAAFIWLLISGLENALEKARKGAAELKDANRELNAATRSLEENQNALLVANQQLSQRAERINTIANISKTITLIQELERLLPSLATIIGERFGYFHVGIFLLVESGEAAVLRASNSEGGAQMIERKYRVKVPSYEVVGTVADRGEARIADAAEIQAARVRQPELPETQSQLALPLKVREIVIGVLDIQSASPAAFTDEDVSTLQILADQAAIAIQNARSSEQAKDALLKAEIVSRQLTTKAWREYSEAQDHRGYRYDGIKPEPIRETIQFAENERPLTIPIRLRGQVIGNLKLKPTESARHWTEDEKAMAEATAERVALALESARLLEDAQNRARREAFLSEISTKLGASFQLDSILRDTVEELGQTFRNARVSFQLTNLEAVGATRADGVNDNGSEPN